MPRRAKPFFFQGAWYTDAGGHRTKLAEGRTNRDAAEDALLEHLQRIRANRVRTYPEITLKQLVNQFLEHCKVNRSEDTFKDHYFSLKRFVKKHAARRAREISFLDAEQYKNSLVRKGRKPSTINHFVISLNACFNWAVRGKLLPENPFRGLEKLPTAARKRLITKDEFQSLLRACSDAIFRQVLLVLRYTGARPKEIRQLTWGQVDWDHCLFICHEHKASRTAREPFVKLIPFPPIIRNLLEWRRRKYGNQTHVFLNRRGQPWTKDACRQRMAHLREKARILPDAGGEQLVLYSNRHTYLTGAVRGGVTTPQLQSLGGWTSVRMANKYVHLDGQDVTLAGAKAVEALRNSQQSGK